MGGKLSPCSTSLSGKIAQAMHAAIHLKIIEGDDAFNDLGQEIRGQTMLITANPMLQIHLRL
jgi:hypothetical protein